MDEATTDPTPDDAPATGEETMRWLLAGDATAPGPGGVIALLGGVLLVSVGLIVWPLIQLGIL